jgi:hypothetical protein
MATGNASQLGVIRCIMSSAAAPQPPVTEQRALNYHFGNNDLTEMIWQRLRMPWMSESRILQYSIGHDFTNTIDIENGPSGGEGDAYFDIDTGKFHVLDYIHGSHGDFAVAQTVGPPEDDVLLISLVETSVGHCILNAMRVMQRLWRTGRPQHMASSRDMLAAKCSSSFALAFFSLRALRYQIRQYLRHVRGMYELAFFNH